MFSRFAPRILAVLFVLIPALASAQEKAVRTWRNGKPLVRVWYPATIATDQDRFLDELAKPPQGPSANNASDETALPAQDPKPAREGLLMYFNPARTPPVEPGRPPRARSASDSLVLVRFRRIPSRDEFKKFVRKATGVDSESALGTLQSKSDGFEYSQQFYTVQLGPQRWSAIPDFLKGTSRYWRYSGGYVIHGDAPEIMTMDLPAPGDLEPPSHGARRDIYAEMDLDALLPRHRKPLWEMIRLRFEAQLQRRDDEPATDFALRKALGELYFHLLQALAVDVKSVRLGVDFADERNPAVADLEITARRDSDLASALGSGTRRHPRLGTLIEQPAVLTLATSWGMPERAERTVDSLVEYFRKQLTDRVGLSFETAFAFDDFVDAVRKSLNGKSEVVLKMARSDAGFTLFGGIQLDEAAAAADGLGRLVDGLTSVTGGGVSRSTDRAGRPVLSFHPEELPPVTTGLSRNHLPAEAHFTLIGTVLYFSFGGRDSLDVLQRAIDGTGNTVARPTDGVPLALVDVSLERWLSGEEKIAGFNRIPQLALEAGGRLLQQLTSNPAEMQLSTTSTVARGYVVELNRPNANQNADTKNTGGNGQFKVITNRLNANARGTYLDIVGQNPSVDQLKASNDTGADDLKRHLKDRQSRVRIELSADKRKAKLRATVGLGVIKWICSSLIRGGQSNPFADIIVFSLSTQARSAAIRVVPQAPSGPDN